MDQYALILTATFDPGPYSTLLQPTTLETRVAEYESALKYWLNYPDPRISGICFCENSGADLSSLRDQLASLTHRPFELLSFQGNDRPAGFHYGYSELGSIDYAVQNSELIHKNRKFIKVTGRLRFPKLSQLLDKTASDVEFMADCHRYKQDSGLPLRMRTQLFLADRTFYETTLLNSRYEIKRENSFIEEFLMRKLWPLRNRSKIVFRFPLECQPDGYSASLGTTYNLGMSRFKSKLRGILRILAPRFWF